MEKCKTKNLLLLGQKRQLIKEDLNIKNDPKDSQNESEINNDFIIENKAKEESKEITNEKVIEINKIEKEDICQKCFQKKNKLFRNIESFFKYYNNKNYKSLIKQIQEKYNKILFDKYEIICLNCIKDLINEKGNFEQLINIIKEKNDKIKTEKKCENQIKFNVISNFTLKNGSNKNCNENIKEKTYKETLKTNNNKENKKIELYNIGGNKINIENNCLNNNKFISENKTTNLNSSELAIKNNNQSIKSESKTIECQKENNTNNINKDSNKILHKNIHPLVHNNNVNIGFNICNNMNKFNQNTSNTINNIKDLQNIDNLIYNSNSIAQQNNFQLSEIYHNNIQNTHNIISSLNYKPDHYYKNNIEASSYIANQNFINLFDNNLNNNYNLHMDNKEEETDQVKYIKELKCQNENLKAYLTVQTNYYNEICDFVKQFYNKVCYINQLNELNKLKLQNNLMPTNQYRNIIDNFSNYNINKITSSNINSSYNLQMQAYQSFFPSYNNINNINFNLIQNQNDRNSNINNNINKKVNNQMNENDDSLNKNIEIQRKINNLQNKENNKNNSFNNVIKYMNKEKEGNYINNNDINNLFSNNKGIKERSDNNNNII